MADTWESPPIVCIQTRDMRGRQVKLLWEAPGIALLIRITLATHVIASWDRREEPTRVL